MLRAVLVALAVVAVAGGYSDPAAAEAVPVDMVATMARAVPVVPQWVQFLVEQALAVPVVPSPVVAEDPTNLAIQYEFQ
jgi:hypothetical protein